MNKNDIKKLEEAYTLRGVVIHQLQERVASLEEEIAHLKEVLRLQQERLFGKKSESIASPPSKTTVVTSHTRKIPPRGHRQLNTEQLPKYTVIHDLPDTEKNCPSCAGVMHLLGRDLSLQLEIIPVQYCLIEHIRLKYSCRACDSIVMSPKPPAPLPKAIAGR